ncbi:hypothetical protein [Edwardsiella tarda]|uniref:hypothetical protein n=1 Tax=Edwardsiella tarda TaxID=636 RepID=UPI00351BFD41
MITVDEVLEHRRNNDMMNSVQDMSIAEYKDALANDAIVMIDSHGLIVESLSSQVLAADCEQLDLLIECLSNFRGSMRKNNLRDLVSK